MIVMDLQQAKAAKAAELDNRSEEDIDISDEAKNFKPVQISRDDLKKKVEVPPARNAIPDEVPEDKDDDTIENEPDDNEDKSETGGTDSPEKSEEGGEEGNEVETGSGEEAPTADPKSRLP